MRINCGVFIGVHDYVEFSALTIKLNQVWAILYLNINARGTKHNHKEQRARNNAPSSEVSDFFFENFKVFLTKID